MAEESPKISHEKIDLSGYQAGIYYLFKPKTKEFIAS